MRPSITTMLFVAALPAALAGCVDSSGLAPTAPKGPAANVPAPDQWKAYGTIRNVELAIDGQFTTYARAGGNESGQTLTIDLGRPATFNLASLDHGPNPRGFARRLGVFVSLDGQNFTRVHEGPGTRRVSYVLTFAPVVARYVKFQVLQAGPEPWCVAEVGFH